MESHEDLKTKAVIRLFPILIFALTIVAFLPGLQNEFLTWDDKVNFIDNPNYRGLGWSQLQWMFTTTYWGHYQPLSWVTLGLDYLLWGMNPFGYHLTNLVIHGANAVVFYFLCVRLLSLSMSIAPEDFALRIGSALSAVLFAIHPLRVESVAWVTERRDVLSGLFFLLTILWYIKAATAQTKKDYAKWMALTMVVYVLSLLSKAVGMSLPVVLLVLDVYPMGRLGRGRGRWFGAAARGVWWEKVPFILLAVGAAVIAAIAQTGAMKSLSEHGPAARLAQVFFGLAFYLWKTVLPVGLSPLYEMPVRLNPLDGRFIVSGAVVLTVTIVFIIARRRWPAALASWACYVILLAPVLGIAQSGPQLVADRYSYLSCLGWAILAGAGVLYGWGSRWWGWVAVGFTGVVVLLGVLTWKQVQVWHDSERLFRYVLTVNPDSKIAHNDLGNVLFYQGHVDEAINHYRRSLEIDPNNRRARFNLAGALSAQGKADEVMETYREALRANPASAVAHADLGDALAAQGQLDEAIEHFRKAIEIEPGLAIVHHSLGQVLAQKGLLSEAITRYAEALEIEPDSAVVHNNMGLAYFLTGEFRGAIEQYRRAVEIDPGNAVAHFNLGNALSQIGETESAVQQYRIAIKYDPRFAEAHRRLGVVLDALGRTEEAITQYQIALEIRPQYATAQYNWGDALLKRNDVAGAIGHYRQALQIDPIFAQARQALNLALRKQGKH